MARRSRDRALPRRTLSLTLTRPAEDATYSASETRSIVTSACSHHVSRFATGDHTADTCEGLWFDARSIHPTVAAPVGGSSAGVAAPAIGLVAGDRDGLSGAGGVPLLAYAGAGADAGARESGRVVGLTSALCAREYGGALS